MKRLVLSAAALSLAACATPYGEMGLMGGVDATPIAGGMYRISARGNAYTDPARIQDFVLLRAAETAIEAGYPYFRIQGATDRSREGSFTTPGTSMTTSSAFGSATTYGNTTTGSAWGSSSTTYNLGQTFNFVRPGQDVLIQMLSEPEPGAFPAQEVLDNIGPRYGVGDD